ncbi:piggyBac transposable element-derived protein 2-like [Rhopalosiphum padi]|uniref:piggyBac transposable element-derived protein 2-like n=1 Tax=Rhopalosiphum padi TaxID=40932 RepID=UPI00298E56BC|nr:piggyBac transposable element-derived protein 2-like [Rhopalosiphum padi]
MYPTRYTFLNSVFTEYTKMYSKARKMIAMACPPVDSGSDGSDDDNASEIPQHEMEELMAMLNEELEDFEYNEMLVNEFEKEQETVDENILQENNIEPNYIITKQQWSQDTPILSNNLIYSQAIPSPSQATPSCSQATTSPSQSTPSSSSRRSKRLHKSPNIFNQGNEKIQINNQPNLINPTQKIKKVPLNHFEFKWTKSSPNFSVEVPLNQEYPFNKSVCTSVTEIKDLIGIMLIMGIVKMPAYSDYWSPYTRYSQIANVMSLKRYKQLMRCLHFCNNEETDDTDRFFKVRKLIDIIRINCLSVPQGKRFSIDEMMVPYKGKKAGSRKQYMKNKPKKWGFKLFFRAGIDGMIYDFLTYSGESTFRSIHFSPYEISYFGLGPKVVIALCFSIPDKPLFEIRIWYFKSWNFEETASAWFPIIDDKTMIKQSRGSFTSLCDKSKKVSIVKWLDNKIVCLASSYTSENTQNTSYIQRYSKEKKKRILVPYPNIVKEYNSHMGGVDLADMFVALYRTGLKSHKWYMSLFSQMLDICVNNAWILYRRDCKALGEKQKRLKEFRHEIGIALTSKDKLRLGRRPLEKPYDFIAKKIKN